MGSFFQKCRRVELLDNQAERRVLVVKVLGVEFFDGSVFSHNLMCSFRLSSMEETQTIMLGNIGTEKVVWNGLGSMNFGREQQQGDQSPAEPGQ